MKRSRAAWHLRIASNVGIGACQILGAALEPDEKLRSSKRFARAFWFSKNVEALRWSARVAMGSTRAECAGG